MSDIVEFKRHFPLITDNAKAARSPSRSVSMRSDSTASAAAASSSRSSQSGAAAGGGGSLCRRPEAAAAASRQGGPGIRQVTVGQMTYVLPDRTVVYNPGDFFFEAGNVNHTALNKTDAPMVHVLFEILPADWSGPSLIPVQHH